MDSFAAAVRALAGGAPRDWSGPAVAALLGRAGFAVERTPTGRFEAGPPTADLRVDVVADPDVADPSSPGAVYGIGLTPTGGDLAAALTAAQQALGPPPTVGGPGPWVRWPTPTVWWTLARSAGTGVVRLFAEPADRAAQDEQRDMEFSTLAALPYLWRVDDESGLPAGTWFPTARPARTVDVLQRQLTLVCAALGEATRWLPDHVPGVTLVVRPRRGRDEVRCQVDASGCAVQAGPACSEHPATELGSHAAAEATVAGIRSWGVDAPGKQLREVSSARSGRRLSLPGLGLPHGRG